MLFVSYSLNLTYEQLCRCFCVFLHLSCICFLICSPSVADSPAQCFRKCCTVLCMMAETYVLLRNVETYLTNRFVLFATSVFVL